MAFSVGDLVLLKSGSMRMVVEAVHEDGTVSTVWANDGLIGRDRFLVELLNKAEDRADRGQHGGRDRDDRSGGFRGGRDRDDRGGHGGGPGGGYRGRDRDDRDDRGGHGGGGYRGRDRDDRDDRPRGKQGWDGKPREKKHFRKDD